MRPEKLYLVDIQEAADAIQRFIEPVSEDAFLVDELRQSGVLQKLIIIGEAAGRLPKAFQDRYPEQPRGLYQPAGLGKRVDIG